MATTSKNVPQTGLPKTGTAGKYTLFIDRDPPRGHQGYGGWRPGEPLYYWKTTRQRSEGFTSLDDARAAAHRNWRGEGGVKAPTLPPRLRVATLAEREAGDRFTRLNNTARFGNPNVANRFFRVHGEAMLQARIDIRKAEEREVRRAFGHAQTYPGKPRLDGYGGHQHNLSCINTKGEVICGR